MSFSSDTKKEALEIVPPARHCRLAEFAALFSLTAELAVSRRGRRFIIMHTENLTVAEKSFILVKKVFHIIPETGVRKRNVLSGKTSFFLVIKGQKDVSDVLAAMKLSEDPQGIEFRDLSRCRGIVRSTCCKRAFLRGVFIAAGSVTDPEKEYHLELALPDSGYSSFVRGIMGAFGYDVKEVLRKGNHVLYLKEGSQISDFLSIIQTVKAMMAFENIRIVKELRNTVNRQVNCETANIDRTVTASQKQREDIRCIMAHMGLEKLSPGLREAAELRLENPDASLKELAAMIGGGISRSGVNHRFRRISEIADSFR